MNESPRARARATPQPPCSDPGWSRRCRPLLEYLGKPRSWEQLVGWASERGMSGCRLRNMLAWLEGQGIAGTHVLPHLVPTLGVPVWRLTTPASALS